VVAIAYNMVFEQNTAQTRLKFVSDVSVRLGLIQLQFGIDSFDVIMDSRNNTTTDEDNNRANGTIIIEPTRAVEEIAIDFIIDQSGVSFV